MQTNGYPYVEEERAIKDLFRQLPIFLPPEEPSPKLLYASDVKRCSESLMIDSISTLSRVTINVPAGLPLSIALDEVERRTNICEQLDFIELRDGSHIAFNRPALREALEADGEPGGRIPPDEHLLRELFVLLSQLKSKAKDKEGRQEPIDASSSADLLAPTGIYSRTSPSMPPDYFLYTLTDLVEAGLRGCRPVACLLDVVLYSLEAFLIRGRHKLALRVCPLCGRLHFPSHLKSDYCPFECPEERGKSCKDARKLIASSDSNLRNRVKSDEGKFERLRESCLAKGIITFEEYTYINDSYKSFKASEAVRGNPRKNQNKLDRLSIVIEDLERRKKEATQKD